MNHDSDLLDYIKVYEYLKKYTVGMKLIKMTTLNTITIQIQ